MATDSKYRRIKHGQQPGDVGKSVKIAMREGKLPLGDTVNESSLESQRRRAKGYRKDINAKTETINRRRAKKTIAEALDDSD